MPSFADAIETVVHRPPVMIDDQATLRQAAELLVEESIGIAVVRGTHPPAVISERDIVAALAEGADPDADQVSEYATMDVVTASPHDSIARVGSMMVTNEIRHVPIVVDRNAVGVAGTRDVLAVAIEDAGVTAES